MDTLPPYRQQIIESIQTLPEDSLVELTSFVAYLRHKATEQQAQAQGNFLLSVADLGTDEAILADEVDAIRGWSFHPDESV